MKFSCCLAAHATPTQKQIKSERSAARCTRNPFPFPVRREANAQPAALRVARPRLTRCCWCCRFPRKLLIVALVATSCCCCCCCSEQHNTAGARCTTEASLQLLQLPVVSCKFQVATIFIFYVLCVLKNVSISAVWPLRWAATTCFFNFHEGQQRTKQTEKLLRYTPV